MGELELALPYCLACDYLLSECRCNNKPTTIFLRDLLKDGADLAVLIPSDAAPLLIVERLRECTGLDGEVRKIGTLVALAIGRCLMLAAENPAIWRAAGYSDFAAFERGEVEDKGIAHGTWFNSKKVQRVFRGMRIEDRVLNGGITNVITAAYLLPPDASERQKVEALGKIALPVAEYREWIEGKYKHENGAASYGRISYEGNLAHQQMVAAWLADPRAQELAGTKQPLAMLAWLVEQNTIELDEQMPIEHTAFGAENGEGVPF